MASPTPVKILIVDDKPANLLALEAILQRPDYALIRAASGAEAIRWVEHELFAAIVLDVQMPGLDGYETARRIKKLPNGRDIPIIFVTAVYKEDEDARHGYAAGGLDYFAKPLEPEVLKTKIQIYADLFRMTRQAAEHEKLMSAIAAERHAQRALDKVLETVSEGVMIVDASGAIDRTNEEARRIWCGAQLRPLSGPLEFVGWWSASGKPVQPKDWAMHKALKSGQVQVNEPITIRCFDGKSKIVLESASPLVSDDGKILGAVVILKEMGLHALEELLGKRRPRNGDAKATRRRP